MVTVQPIFFILENHISTPCAIKQWILAFVICMGWHLCLYTPNLNAQELIVLTCEEPPTNYRHKEDIIGTSVDIVQAILTRQGLKNKVQMLPWARAYKKAVSRSNVIIFTCGMTPDRVNRGFTFIGPVITRTHGLYSLKGKAIPMPALTTVLDNNLVIGGMNEDWRTKYLAERGIPVDKVHTHALNLKKLLRSRIDLMISSDIELPYLTKSIGISNDLLVMNYPLRSAPSFIMISKGTPNETIHAWQQAFNSLKSNGFMNKTAQKWSEILGYTIMFVDGKGFIKKPSS